MRVLFLHGWTSVPGGVKPTHLKGAGLTVFNPAIPDDDFARSVAIGQEILASNDVDVVVGSSRGGAVAMNLNYGARPLVLLCPAWKRWGEANSIATRAAILHSRSDDVIPFGDSEELVAQCSADQVRLIEVGADHRLATPDALDAMLAECRRLVEP